MFFFSIPNLTTSFSFVLSAMKCFVICDSFFACSRNHFLAVYALVIVSWVVKDFEAMRKRVLSGFTFFNVSVIWLASIFETKYVLIFFTQYGFNASVTISGPRSLPPIPIFTTYRILLPV